MKKYSMLFLLVIPACLLSAQGSSNPFMNDANGRPLYLRVNYVPDGSPYLYDDYSSAEVTLANGKVYPNIKVKINLVEREISYLNDKGEEMITTTPVSRVSFYSFVSDGTPHEAITLQNFATGLNTPAAAIFQVVEDGAAKLLKELIVTYSDIKKYGEATITRTFKRKEVYAAWLPGFPEPRKIERNKEAVSALFGPKQTQVAAFIEEKKLKCRTDKDIVDVIRFYNTL